MHFSKKNVVVLLKGGLGNQLFQYAAGKSLALRLGVDLTIDLNWYIDNGKGHTKFILGKFLIDDDFFTPPFFIPKKFRSAIYSINRKTSYLGWTNPILEDVKLKFNHDLLNITHPVILDGYWQNEIYFNQYRKQIIQKVQLREKICDENEKLLNKIKCSNSICVHIRRGDYVTNPSAASIHGTCSKEYYHKAIDLFSRTLDNPFFYIFSDDEEWVKSNINIKHQSILVTSNTNKPELDFILMKSCKNFIIANSTFSWWAAWLSSYHKKKVIAPRRWFIDNELDNNFRLNDNWFRL